MKRNLDVVKRSNDPDEKDLAESTESAETSTDTESEAKDEAAEA